MPAHDDSEHEELRPSAKLTRRPNACDTCRRKKSSGPKLPSAKCSVCIEYNLDCAFNYVPKKRGRPTSYILMLEKRIRLLEGLLKKTCPDLDLLTEDFAFREFETTEEHGSHHSSSASSLREISPASSSNTLHDQDENSIGEAAIRKVISITLGSQDDQFRDDLDNCDVITEKLNSLALHSTSSEKRFWGRSSDVTLLRNAMCTKNTYEEKSGIDHVFLQNRRPIYWMRPIWETKHTHLKLVSYTFPPPDLLRTLVDAYFEHVNLLTPLLHRPTFERSLDECLHLRNEGFGGVLLLVCAVGARYTKTIDLRTLVDGYNLPFYAGWKWYSQVQVVKDRILEAPTLYDLQSYCLAIEYMQRSHSPQAVRNLVGFGIHLALDVGMHRRRVPRERMTVEDELWKRAFWVLVSADRWCSMEMGRPCAIHDHHFDLDMPIECDDEFWEHPDPRRRFKQPRGIPSTVTAFNQQLHLEKIIPIALNSIYSIKTKFWESLLRNWEERMTSELDSALNNWIGSLPEILRWTPNRDRTQADNRFFHLSASLAIRFHSVKVLIHRPCIQKKGELSPLASSALEICNAAARSCSLIFEEQTKRSSATYPYMQINAMNMSIMLLVSKWQRAESMDAVGMSYLKKCLEVLMKAQERWRCAGVFLDILNDMLAEGRLIVPDNVSDVKEKKEETRNYVNYIPTTRSASHSLFSTTPDTNSTFLSEPLVPIPSTGVNSAEFINLGNNTGLPQYDVSSSAALPMDLTQQALFPGLEGFADGQCYSDALEIFNFWDF